MFFLFSSSYNCLCIKKHKLHLPLKQTVQQAKEQTEQDKYCQKWKSNINENKKLQKANKVVNCHQSPPLHAWHQVVCQKSLAHWSTSPGYIARTLECHSDWINVVRQYEGVELPEGNITDVQDSYNYLGIPHANNNNDEAARSQPQPSTSKTGPEEPAEGPEQSLSHPHVCIIRYQQV